MKECAGGEDMEHCPLREMMPKKGGGKRGGGKWRVERGSGEQKCRSIIGCRGPDALPQKGSKRTGVEHRPPKRLMPYIFNIYTIFRSVLWGRGGEGGGKGRGGVK